MDTCHYLVEFTVPNEVNIEERPPEADRYRTRSWNDSVLHSQLTNASGCNR
jgi:hypothetical protein